MISDSLRHEIAEHSCISCGTGIPWQLFFQKKKLKIGFMGGSVTQGYIQQQIAKEPYPFIFRQLLSDQGYSVETICCAAAGMDTMQGNALAQKEILDKSPDLVFLEYGINETTLRHSVLSFESLLRKLLEAENPPIVCIFIVRSKQGYSCESFMRPIAEHYGLPCVCLPSGIGTPLTEGRLNWEDYADAESHPSTDGHRLLAECLMYLLEQAKSIPEAPQTPCPLPEPWLDAPYRRLQWFPAGTLTQADTDFETVTRDDTYYPLVYCGNADHARFILNIEAKAIVLFFEAHHLPEYGSARVLVDGKEVSHPLINQSVIHCNSIYGWGNAMPLLLVDEEETKAHRVALTPIERNFYLLGIGIVP